MATTDFSYVNAVDSATIVAGSEAATMPSSNLSSTRTGRNWRALAATTYFTATFLNATSIEILAITGGKDSYDSTLQAWVPMLGATDTVQHRLYDASGAQLLDTGAVACGMLPGYRLHVYRAAQAYVAKSWRCDIVATSRASYAYFDLKRAWAGPVWRPAVGIARPWDESWQDDADISRGKFSGGVFVGDGPQYRTMNANLDWMLAADKLYAKELARLAGRRTQVLLVPDQTGDVPREAILGRITSMGRITQSKNTVPPVYEQPFAITQDI